MGLPGALCLPLLSHLAIQACVFLQEQEDSISRSLFLHPSLACLLLTLFRSFSLWTSQQILSLTHG